MAGIGLMAAGLGPFGLGSPTEGASTPTAPAGIRHINPVTRDYEMDATTGQFKQTTSIRQRVLLIALTKIGSASRSRKLGVKLPAKVSENFEAETRDAVRIAYQQMTDVEQVIRIDGVDTVRGQLGRVAVMIRYTDLTTGKQDQVPL